MPENSPSAQLARPLGPDLTAIFDAATEMVARIGADATASALAASLPTMLDQELFAALAEVIVSLVDEQGSHAMTASSFEIYMEQLAEARAELEHLRTRVDVDAIRRAIADPGAVVGRRLGPSWGAGNDSYADQPETVAEWGARAVVALLTGTHPAGRPVVEVRLPDTIPAEVGRG